MVQSVWGNLRTRTARIAWAKAQTARNATGDALFRQWLIDKGIPENVAKKAWATGSRESAIAFLAEQKGWVEYYGLQSEVKAAFKKHAPQ